MDSAIFVSVVTEILRYAVPLFIILLAVCGICHALDRLFLAKHRLEGRIDLRRHYPGILDPAHELYSPETDKIKPDRWCVFISANAESWPIPLDAKGFHWVRHGDPVVIELSYGRLTGKRYAVKLIGPSWPPSISPYKEKHMGDPSAISARARTSDTERSTS